MKHTLLGVGLLGAAVLMSAAWVWAEGDASFWKASRLEKQGDYEGALMAYDALLQKNPGDRYALKKLVECHNKIETQEGQQPQYHPEQNSAKPEDEEHALMPDLPQLTAAESLASTPKK